MTLISIGDLAQSYVLHRRASMLKSQTQTLSTELTTGLVADQGARLRGDFTPVAGIEASLARIEGYRSITAEMGLYAGSMQTTLTTIDSLSTGMMAALLATSTSTTASQVDAVADDARQKLDSILSALNTMVGDRSIFAGTRTNGPAIAEPDVLVTALAAATAGALSAADYETAVNAWFDDPGGFATVMYLGGDALSPIPVAEGETAGIDVTALDPAIVDTLKALCLSAMLDEGAFAGQPETRADLVRRSGERMLESQTGRANLQARLGTTEEQIESASARNAAERSSLQIARNDLLSADPYETASKLEETQTQLETLFAITARMSRLSLVDFL